MDKIHEFTDGCAGQYKSEHTFADFGCQIDRHFFETSHAKGEQDAAGANVKQRATFAVLQRKVTIGSAKDLYDYLYDNDSSAMLKYSVLKNFVHKSKTQPRIYYNLRFKL